MIAARVLQAAREKGRRSADRRKLRKVSMETLSRRALAHSWYSKIYWMYRALAVRKSRGYLK